MRRKKLLNRTAIGLFATPCGYSTYTTNTLKAGGLRVGHESRQPDGTVCGFWAHPNKVKPKGHGRQAQPEGQWDALGLLIRHPFKVAETLPSIGEIHAFDVPWKHDDLVLHALRYWVETFEAARRHLDTMDHLKTVLVRADSRYEADMQDLCNYLQIPKKQPSNGPNSRNKRWPRMSWKAWRQADPDYALRGGLLVTEYGLEEP